MAILLLLNQVDPTLLEKHLKALPDCPQVRIWPNAGEKNDIKCAIVWKHDEGVLNDFPNLKLIASYGAGVENILSDPALPENVPITRFVDDTLSSQMAEYVLAAILNHRLHITHYRELQAATVWNSGEFLKGKNVTILGMGELGAVTGKSLVQNGYIVSGWSRSQKQIESIKSYYGDDQLRLSVSDADYIVCLLPLTPATTGILNKELFSHAKKGAHVINVGRGDHLNEEDLLDALYNQQISSATLDVYSTEPLPSDHPFWKHPKIHMTPHIASATDKEQVARQILENYNRVLNDMPLNNQVDPEKAY